MRKDKTVPKIFTNSLPSTGVNDILILTGSFLVLHIPFLSQAFIIDDGAFIDQALHILKNPAGPYSFDIHLEEVFNFFRYFANPPGFAYFLAAMIKFFGRSEIALHSVCLIFSYIALLAMYALSQEITGRGLYGSLLLLVTPTFLLSSHTVMPDVPAMAFYILAIFLFLRAMDQDELQLYVLSGIVVGISSLLKYSALTILPLMLLYWFLCRRRTLKPLVTFLIVGLVFGAWCAMSYFIYGEVHFISMAVYESSRRPFFMKVIQAVAGLIGVGGATIFPLFLMPWVFILSFGLSRLAGWSTVLSGGIGFLVAIPAYVFPPLIVYDSANRALGALLLAPGCSVFTFVVFRGIHSFKDYLNAVRSNKKTAWISSARSLLLVCWFLGIFIFNIRLLFTTPKYLVPGLPPLILLLIGVSGQTSRSFPSFPSWQKGAILFTTAALSLMLSVVDSSYGNSHKKFITETLPARFPDSRIWFNGHWSIRYYSEKMGYNYLGMELSGHTRPKSGDIIFEVEEAVRHDIPAVLVPRIKERGRENVFPPLPVLLTSSTMKAGYWSHGLGVLPYVITDMPMSTFVTYEVE